MFLAQRGHPPTTPSQPAATEPGPGHHMAGCGPHPSPGQDEQRQPDQGDEDDAGAPRGQKATQRLAQQGPHHAAGVGQMPKALAVGIPVRRSPGQVQQPADAHQQQHRPEKDPARQLLRPVRPVRPAPDQGDPHRSQAGRDQHPAPSEHGAGWRWSWPGRPVPSGRDRSPGRPGGRRPGTPRPTRLPPGGPAPPTARHAAGRPGPGPGASMRHWRRQLGRIRAPVRPFGPAMLRPVDPPPRLGVADLPVLPDGARARTTLGGGSHSGLNGNTAPTRHSAFRQRHERRRFSGRFLRPDRRAGLRPP